MTHAAAADMTGKVVIVTGANSGIGKYTAIGLARAGARVVLACRNAERGNAALDVVRAAATAAEPELLLVDLASFASVRAFARDALARLDRIDVLLNNAGVYMQQRRLTQDGYEMTFQVNHLSHFLITELLRERLVRSAPARVVTVASTAHMQAVRGLNFRDLQMERLYLGWLAYARSKLANILFTRELARRLDDTGVTANSLHPGVVATELGQAGDSNIFAIGAKIVRPFLTSPERGASTSLYLACSPDVDGVTGEYFANRKRARTTRHARDDSAAQRLWKVSEALVSGATATAG